jgi:hypothetical protein
MTASVARTRSRGGICARAATVASAPTSAAIVAETSAPSRVEKNVPGTLSAIARRNRPAA